MLEEKEEIDLEKVKTNDLLEEISFRNLDEGEREILQEIYADYFKVDNAFEINTLDEQMKYDYLFEIFDKYTLAELETKIPK